MDRGLLDDASSHARADALDLTDLLTEIAARGDAAHQTREQLGSLLDAVLPVRAEPQLPEVLGRIVRSACELVHARYGALGVLSPDGRQLSQFVTHGISDEERRRIGEPPRGRGVLGLLLRDARPLRLHDLRTHPASYGMPPHHPVMRSFLGAPIRIRDAVYGNLYLTEKEGGDDFTAQDESLLGALATVAGVAIDNARLYDRSRTRQLWAAATSELVQSLLEAEDEDLPLALLAARVGELTGAAVAAVALCDDAGSLVLRAVSFGDRAVEDPSGVLLTGPGWEELLDARQPVLHVPGGPPDPRAQPAEEARSLCGLDPDGSTAFVPLAAGRGRVGLLLTAWADAEEAGPTDAMPQVAPFALQAGAALLAARAQRDRARVALLEDRDRIARDMHDNVVQRLFATGLSLQSAVPLARHPVVRERLGDAVDELDAAIREIREAIFGLHTVDPDLGVLVVLDRIIETYAGSLGFTPELVVEGRLGTLGESLRADAVAVVREGLANVARHAAASAVRVTLSTAHGLDITVVDNGVGTSPDAARSGLVNLRKRALARGGSLSLRPAEGGGTLLSWHVPPAPGPTRPNRARS
ncbi:MAG TPA: GAF domain-containing protein [Intrasporangium sp.]|uniref:GAF domain-containing sensor histidine kinase n=1 Tax=Intrasporangium sp. TaxID=1925024 RepID=UPI002D76842E|nr:GAF domain-containing protein [Intrasporangium sp.]HET7397187.1 GAF domain-containing protein [Intrasporangium sp.]